MTFLDELVPSKRFTAGTSATRLFFWPIILFPLWRLAEARIVSEPSYFGISFRLLGFFGLGYYLVSKLVMGRFRDAVSPDSLYFLLATKT